MNAKNITPDKVTRNYRLTLATFCCVAASLIVALPAHAQESDRLFVNIGVGGAANNPQTLILTEGGPETGSLPLPDVLIKVGYVKILEPDGTTVSDYVYSVTGASITLTSDPNATVPNGLPLLGTLIETRNGLANQNIGDLFSTGAPVIAANQIQVSSDGDNIPTVSQWGLIVMTLLLLTAATIVIARRRPATKTA